jgi:LPS-assembly protein
MGNVVFRQGTNQISADRAEIDTNTRLGTFYNATGFTTVQPPKQAPRPGAVVPPPVSGQENVVYFFGDTVEKTGPRRYTIKNGGFTTCVQPTPRWNLSADKIVLNVDHYTFLRNAVMTVKGVPMLYLPVLYYPTKKGDRATGFLLPTYGASTLRGQSIHNAFFWAIDRSQDATFLYDWFSKTGQGTGGEYRYNFGGGSDGSIRAYVLNEQFQAQDVTQASSDTRSYEVHGTASQPLPFKMRARARVDYFSSIATSQTFNTNIYDASRSQRGFGGNIVGSWDGYNLNATFDHNEYFSSQTNSNVSGTWPRLNVTRNEQPLANTPFYLSVAGEFAHVLSNVINVDANNTTSEFNQGFTRLDFNPQIRFPFKKWQWFTVNSSAGWRETYYSRSYDPATIDPSGLTQAVPSDQGLNRQYVTIQSQVTGPVFSRIWDTPGNSYAEKFKHSIEPYVNFQATSSIDNYSRIIKLEGVDQVVGGAQQYTYGITNRFYAKRRVAPGQVAQSREIFTIDLQQTYYTNDLASTVDRQYQTSNIGAVPSNFSPIALSVRGQPGNDFNVTMRAEFDPTYHRLRSVNANGNYNWSTTIQTTVGWSKTAYIPELTPTYDPSAESINASTNVKTRDNKYGVLYSFNYDVKQATLIQQRTSVFYNAQCCGLAFEYQTYNFPSSSNLAIPSDHRFFLSFTLAGLGNFSPFNGALSGVPR